MMTMPRFVPPPLSCTAFLVLWGWRTDYLPVALLLAVPLELARFISWRWTLEDADFQRVCNLIGVILLVVAVVQFQQHAAHGLFHLVALLPMLLYPAVLAQTYSSAGDVPLSAVLLSLRWAERRDPRRRFGRVDLLCPYLLLCLLSAVSVAGRYDALLLPLAAVPVCWCLWSWCRRLRRPLAGQLLALLLALALTPALRAAMLETRARLEPVVIAWISELVWRNRDPRTAKTAIGSILYFKRSSRIQLRLAPVAEEPPPLLAEAAYNHFQYNSWRALESDFSVVEPVTGDDGSPVWPLATEATVDRPRALDIAMRFRENVAVAPLPHGTHRLARVAAAEVQRSPLGAVQLELRPGWISYRAHYRNSAVEPSSPQPEDLVVAENYRDGLERYATDLGLRQLPPAQAVERLTEHLRANYRYVLRSGFPRRSRPALLDFLYENRAGHCEYFATATALLLRTAGIPTRYVVGYAVQEFSELEQRYLVRARDAHSWVVAWVDGAWQVIDPTPPVWWELEGENRSHLLLDLWSLLSYRLSGDDGLEEDDTLQSLLGWLVLPLVVLLAWLLARKPRVKPPPRPGAATARAGTDSEFYAVMERLGRELDPRRPGETPLCWLRRCIARREDVAGLMVLLQLHYRYRFDPGGLDPAQRRRLRRDSLAWLQRSPTPAAGQP